ncbi:DUF1648 domain-containing protein [Pseudonocardia sp. GCM10023141]|uniref:DUF1648 domain-containing protein n=1 Tax=Pseudonocardia sp. GCM10023141 TaxID=3252653 RepID=UPI0036101C23
MRPWGILFVGAAWYAAVAVWAAVRIPPGEVPVHFGIDGTADRFGSAGQALTLALLPGIIVLLLGVGLVLLVRRGPLRVLNIPHKDYWLTAAREPLLRRMLAVDVASLLCATLVFLSLIPVWIVEGARGGAGSSSPLVLLPVAVFVVAVPVWSVWLVRVRYRRRG